MKNLRGSDVYQIRANYPHDRNNDKVIQLLYLPLIGSLAASLYLSLWSQVDIQSLTKAPSLFSYLSRLTGQSVIEIDESLRKLEAIGLLKSYQREDAKNRYLLELHLPLTPQKFIHHKILNTLLYHQLGKENFQKTIACFQIYDVDKSQYNDVSASFLDVYDINLVDSRQPLLIDKDYQSKTYQEIESDYQMDLFFEGLQNLQLSKKMLTQDDLQLIKQLGVLYKINAIDMQSLVKTSMVNNQLHHGELVKQCRDYFDLKMPEVFNEIYHKQSIAKSSGEGDSQYDKHIAYLEKITPYDLLKNKQGGREPLKRDLQIVESILTTLQLEPGVMNVLIELTLSQCNHSLARSFMETRASQWKRKKIDTVRDALQESKEYIKYRQKDLVTVDDDEYLEMTNTDKQDINDEKLKNILSNFD